MNLKFCGDSKRRDTALRWLLLGAVVLVPLFKVGAMAALFQGLIGDQVTVHTWFPLVVGKNLILPLLVVLLLYPLKKFYSPKVENIGIAVLLCVSFMAIVVTKDINVWTVLAGIRWLLPFLLIFLLVPFVEIDLLRKMSLAAVVVVVLNLIVQIVQTFYMQPWFGMLPFWGLVARAPGFFLIPSTTAMFVCFSVLLYVLADNRGGLAKCLILFLGLFSVFLTLSGTGFCVMLIVLATVAVGARWRVWFPFIVPASYAFTKVIITYFRGALYYEVSLGTRADILLGLAGASGQTGVLGQVGASGLIGAFSFKGFFNWLFHANFGAGTTAAWLLKYNMGVDIHPVSTDSLLAQFIVNLGGIALIFYLLVMVLTTLISYFLSNREAVLWLVSIGIFSVTTPISEALPMNIILAVAMAYFVKSESFSVAHVKKKMRTT